jgi:hypothetical protein
MEFLKQGQRGHFSWDPPTAFRLRRSGKNAVHRYAGSGYRLSDPPRNGNLRCLGHSVVHHFRRNLNRRFARNKKDAAPAGRTFRIARSRDVH